LAIQSDGKIVVGGTSDKGGGTYVHTLLRFNTDGSLDTTFDTDGIVTTDLSATYNDTTIFYVMLDSDGNIVTVGSGYSGLFSYIIVARYTSTGALDSSFDTDGMFSTTLIVAGALSISQIRYHQAALQSDGKIVIGGYSSNDFRLLRYWP
jgi:uncharacterized delta-60 repeat protein